MAGGQLPICFHELLQLQPLGIAPQMFSFANLTMESQKYIAVRDTTSTPTIVVVDVTKPQTQPMRLQVPADSAIMHLSDTILAYRTDAQDGSSLYVYNLEMKKIVANRKLSDVVVFWKWISASSIALVTNRAVYHWSTEGYVAPIKVFERHANLQGSQIINYKVSKDQKWCVLIGISQKEGRVAGAMQLFSVDAKKDQFIEGHAASFVTYQVPGADTPSTLICMANRTAAGSKFMVIEVGKPKRFQRKATDIYYPPDAVADFPVAMQVSDKHKVAFMITKFGYLHVFDIVSATPIYMTRVSNETIFVTAAHEATSGIVGVNRRGQVLSVSLDEKNLIPYITTTLKNFQMAIDLSSRCGLPGAEALFEKQFMALFQAGDYQGAARVASGSPGNILRNIQTIQRYQHLPAQPGQTPPLLMYFGVLLEKGKLNHVETLELCRVVLGQGRLDLVHKWLEAEKLECSEELGDMLRQYDLKTAMQVYYRGNNFDKGSGSTTSSFGSTSPSPSTLSSPSSSASSSSPSPSSPLIGSTPTLLSSPSPASSSSPQNSSRIDDVAKEDLNNNLPIKGVWDQPLLSFEEAVQIANVPTLDIGDVYSCLEYFEDVENPPPGLTIDEACAVRFYTMETPFYGAFNSALRTRERNEAKCFFPFLQLLLLAMHKLPKSKGTLFRGTKNLPVDVIDEYKRKAETKKCVFWGACSSTTTSVKTLSNPMFCGKEGNRVKFVIQDCDLGVSVQALSAIGVEKEVLLPPCLRFVVEDYVDLGNGLLEFQLRYSAPRREVIPLVPPPQFLSSSAP